MKRVIGSFACIVVVACGGGGSGGGASPGDGGGLALGDASGGQPADAAFGSDAAGGDAGSDGSTLEDSGGTGGGACTLDQTGLSGATMLTVTPINAAASCFETLSMPQIADSLAALRGFFAPDAGGGQCPQDPASQVAGVDFSSQRVLLVPTRLGGPPNVSFVDDTGAKLVVGIRYGVSGAAFPAAVLLIPVPKVGPSVVELRQCQDTCNGACPP